MNRGFAVLILLLISFPLFCADDETVLKFDRSAWNIGMESFTGDLEKRNDYLKNSLPDLILKDLDQTETHVLSEKEKKRYRDDIIAAEKISVVSKLADAYAARDKQLFSGDKISDSKVDELRKRLTNLGQVDGSKIKTAEMLPVTWVKGDGDGGLLDPDRYTPRVICKTEDLDYLVSGTIREIDDYFRFELNGYDRSTGEKTVLYSSAGSLSDMDSMAAGAADELRSLILGRAWTALKISTNDPDSLIYSNGSLIGVGSADVRNLEPGSVLLEAVGADNTYWSEKVELTALDHRDISAKLSEAEKTLIAIESIPSGANVYIGAKWAGKTPLNLPRYKERNLWITIKNDGYYDKSFAVTSDSPDTVIFSLEKETITRLEDFKQKKKAFYRSLGRFSLSVAAPVITGGIRDNYLTKTSVLYAQYQSTGTLSYYDEAKQMEKNYYISGGVLACTIAVSSGLLIDVFVKLSRYIKAAEALTE